MVKFTQWLSAAVVLALGRPATAEGDPAVLASEIGRLNDESLLWGPYKPNLYFGVRPRLPQGLWTGLMWTGVSSFEQVPKGSSMMWNTSELEVMILILSVHRLPVYLRTGRGYTWLRLGRVRYPDRRCAVHPR